MPPLIATITFNPAIDVSCVVDRVQSDEKLRCHDERRDPGGGGINVARVLSRLGADVRAYFTSSGMSGELLSHLLDGDDVVHVGVPGSGETRRNLHVRETSSTAQYRFTMPGPMLLDRDAARWLAIAPQIEAPWVVVSGSLPPGLEDDFVARFVERVPRTARVVLDTSGPALDRALSKRVHVAKPNRRELSRSVGRDLDGPEDVERAARELFEARGLGGLVVSLGPCGATVVDREGVTHLPAPSVLEKSKVGAGDSMVALLVHRLSLGEPLAEAARWGVAAGAAALLTEGTELCRIEDVVRLHDALERRGRR